MSSKPTVPVQEHKRGYSVGAGWLDKFGNHHKEIDPTKGKTGKDREGNNWENGVLVRPANTKET